MGFDDDDHIERRQQPPQWDMMLRRLLLVVVFLAGCSGPPLPVNTLLWRVGEWRTAAAVRTAPAVIISFRASGEYIEHYCRVIEHADDTVYLSSTDPHIITIGTWKKNGKGMIATRAMTSKAAPSLCGDISFEVNGNSVLSKDGQYSPVTRLVSPDFENYITTARRSAKPCPSPSH